MLDSRLHFKLSGREQNLLNSFINSDSVFLSVIVAQGRVMVPSSVKPLSDEMINFINNLNSTWKVSLTISLRLVKG